jgi:NAD(P)-dependent dehydrogenase (short-subunit alcohol dehydrogenase family)
VIISASGPLWFCRAWPKVKLYSSAWPFPILGCCQRRTGVLPYALAERPTAAARARIAIQKMYPFSVGEPEDMAPIAVFLASDESRMITGVTIAADGGRSSYLKVYAGEDDD